MPRTTQGRYKGASTAGGSPVGRGGSGRNRSRRRTAAFTLTELLVVIAIIGILAASSVPAVKGLTQANTVATGSRQVLDELAYARQLAMSGRRTVYLVFVPPTMREHFQLIRHERPPARQDRLLRQMTNLVSGQYTGYALFSRRSVGDQPGRSTPRYLTEWRTLPDGMVFASLKYSDLAENWKTKVDQTYGTNILDRPLPYGWFPFPTTDSPELRLPYVAFDPRGRLYYEKGEYPNSADAALTLLRGSVLYPKDKRGTYLLSEAPDLVVTARSNRTDVLVDWLTGRARALNWNDPRRR